ncbi:VOC family protein [Lapidilactobacillus mulanensis]|uniref:VOC family protein n=1 Tax=Lapidilactobacillus mulanensis TaxID=2485999 RepID=A0ABW4DJI0_9LACO|nr:VOC family protein [Lapidilactobacillus mulanensis]
MATMVFANFPVKDLAKATDFYTMLGFQQNTDFSDEHASAMVWDEGFVVMLLTRDFYKKFIGEREIIDPHTMSGALIAFTLPSPEAVNNFADLAKANGGTAYQAMPDIPAEQMVSFEVVDLDGNILEPHWMAPMTSGD